MAKGNKNRKTKLSLKSSDLQVVNPNAAGIDIGSTEHWVAVPPDRDEKPIRCFQSFTSDLHKLADWLEKCGVDTAVMESTGVYWIPLFQILEERGCKVFLVNAHHVKNVTGRKEDDSDSEWARKLHTYGLLHASFQPDDKIIELRSFLRHREMLVSYSASHIQHMQKALTLMNLQLHHVISDITGVTGMKIIRAIIDGERDPEVLATYRDKRIKADAKTIAKSLEGNYSDEYLFPLKQSLQLYDFYQHQIDECDQKIEALLKTFPTYDNVVIASADNTSSKKRKKVSANAPKFAVEKYINEISGVNLFAVDGFNSNNLLGIIAETGLDMEKWKTEKHFTSWLRLSPNNKISGGKILSRHTLKTNNRANKLFRLAAQSLANSDCALGAYYRRLRYRIGPSKAIVATARKLACLYYIMLKNKIEYQDIGAEQYDKKYRARQINNLNKRAQLLGFKLVEA